MEMREDASQNVWPVCHYPYTGEVERSGTGHITIPRVGLVEFLFTFTSDGISRQ